jgi:hypothetical protein
MLRTTKERLRWFVVNSGEERKHLAKHAREVIPWLGALLVLCWPWSPLPMAYLVNDDLAIIEFLSRGLDPVFLSVLLGRLLSAGYRLFGTQAPVYPLFLNACLALCAATYAGCVLTARPRGPRDPVTLFALAVYAVLLCRLCMFITFTTVAAAVAAHGVFLLLTCKHRGSALVAGTLVGTGALIRFDAAALSGLLFAVPLTLWAVSDPGRLRRAAFAALPLLVLLTAEQAVVRLDVSDAYRAFAEFNAVRGKVHGFPIMEQQRGNAALLEANRWTTTDFELFLNWSYPDETKFNLHTVSNVLTLPVPAVPAGHEALVGEQVAQFFTSHSAYLSALAWMLVLSFALANRRWIIAGVTHALLFLGVGLALELWFRFPVRVGESAILAGMLAMFALFRLAPSADVRRIARARSAIATGACVLFIAWRGSSVLAEGIQVRARQQQRNTDVAHLNAQYANRILVVWPSLPPPRQLLHPVRRDLLRFAVMFYGWTTFSEFFYADIHRLLGVETGAEVWPALARRDNVVFMAPESGMRLVEQTLLETYRLPTQSILLETFDGVSYWRLQVRDVR